MTNAAEKLLRPGETKGDFEEKAVLSRRRAVVFIFLVGLLTISLMFLIRVDIEAKQNRIGTYMRIIEKTSPVFLGSVEAAVSGGKEDEDNTNRSSYIYYQRHPKELLGRLFG